MSSEKKRDDPMTTEHADVPGLGTRYMVRSDATGGESLVVAMALHLRNHLEKFYRISYQTGATRADSWIDLEGGMALHFPGQAGPVVLYSR
jgi:oxepin-CoA hydrolase/3-oxo-5,6-dehydrosuberyl-CoA semialdehyde dehydrogenase